MKRIPFRYVLPASQIALAFALFKIGQVELENELTALHAWSIVDWCPLAVRIAAIINGPVTVLAGYPPWTFNTWEPLRLSVMCAGIASLWFYLGWMIDSRHVANRPSRRVLVAALVFTLLSALSAFAAWLHPAEPLQYPAALSLWTLAFARHVVHVWQRRGIASLVGVQS